MLPSILSFIGGRLPAIHTLSLHDALPISLAQEDAERRAALARGEEPDEQPTAWSERHGWEPVTDARTRRWAARDRKSTRLNSSHANISYAVFCLKKKKRPASNRHSNRHLQ